MSRLHVEVKGLEFSYDSAPLLQDINLRVERGDMVALLGPNGAGKSTLLRCLARALRPQAGVVLLDGQDIGRLPVRQTARRVGVVPQVQDLHFDFTVEEVVTMGRYPHLGRFGRPGPEDVRAVREAMDATRTAEMSERLVTALSGGEQQRVAIARALAQEPQVLLLDEPTAHLDIRYQVEVMELLTRLNREKVLTVIAAVHDLNLAARYFRRFVLMAAGRVLATGTAREVLQPELIRRTYGVEVVVIDHPVLGCPVVLPAGPKGNDNGQG
jgi:iron complex transport system ATP-binding protein